MSVSLLGVSTQVESEMLELILVVAKDDVPSERSGPKAPTARAESGEPWRLCGAVWLALGKGSPCQRGVGAYCAAHAGLVVIRGSGRPGTAKWTRVRHSFDVATRVKWSVSTPECCGSRWKCNTSNDSDQARIGGGRAPAAMEDHLFELLENTSVRGTLSGGLHFAQNSKHFW